MNYIKKLWHKLLRKEVEEYRIEIQDEDSYENYLKITFDPSGNFTVELDIQEVCEESAETFSRILHHMHTGGILQYVMDALELWAETDEVRLIYLAHIAQWLATLSMAATPEMEAQDPASSNDKVAVDPSQVFNFRNMAN